LLDKETLYIGLPWFVIPEILFEI